MLHFGRPDYVVYSYTTPIAWHDSVTDRWTVPDATSAPVSTGLSGLPDDLHLSFLRDPFSSLPGERIALDVQQKVEHRRKR
jgi:hypothetical protein